MSYVNIYVWTFKVAVTNGFTPWEGKIILFLLVVTIIFLFKDYINKIIPNWDQTSFWKRFKNANYNYVLIFAGMIALLLIVMALRLSGNSYKFAIGYYVSWGGIALLVIHAFFDRSFSVVTSNTKNVNNQIVNNQSMMNDMNNQPMMNNNASQPLSNMMNNNESSDNNLNKTSNCLFLISSVQFYD